jgi:hypothetical protein
MRREFSNDNRGDEQPRTGSIRRKPHTARQYFPLPPVILAPHMKATATEIITTANEKAIM